MSDPATAPSEALDLKAAFARAVAAEEDGRLDEAVGLYRAILGVLPVSEAARNLGLILEARGDLAGTEGVYREHLSRRPEDATIRLQLAFLLLRDGRLAEAWPFFEARLQRPGANPKPKLSFPEWQGQPVSSLLIWHEQGLGDQIQFARYAALMSLDTRISLMCHPDLARLFAPLDAEIISTLGQVTIPRHDAWVMSASMPLRLGTTLETIPPAPYLPGRLIGKGIGLVTKGAAGHINDANRSLPPDIADVLRGLPNVRSLEQADTGARDMRETADLIDELDLVISVDSAVAHLAGAMGKDCWLLLPHRADWRWLRGRSDSPWYPSLRLFRQPAPGDWQSVLAEVRRALDERAG